ncbi:MAG: TlpA disulfide reductase family protein [Acidobacteriota bacterium]
MASAEKSPPKSARTRKSLWTPGRALLTLVVVGLLSALGVSSCNSTEVTNAPGANNAPPANRGTANPPAVPAVINLPQDLRDKPVKTLAGESLKLADYADKVLIVNIWATWCGPCRLEMPELVKMSNDYKARGLVVLGLATTYNEHNDAAHVQDYIREQKIPYKIIWDDGTLAQPLVQLVQGRSVIPQSFVISREGRILKHFQGFDPSRTPAQMRQAVEDALNDKGKA